MKELLWLIPALPLTGAIILILGAGKIPKGLSALVGCGSIGLAAIVTLLMGFEFLGNSALVIDQTLWVWFNAGGLTPGITLGLV
jgi:NADH-quinone oxidoreductase subunit L